MTFSVETEEIDFYSKVKRVQEWWATPRFQHCIRPYTAYEVVSNRCSLTMDYPSNAQAKKLWRIMQERRQNKTVSATFGALDPIQGKEVM